jgi:hypothetical protein
LKFLAEKFYKWVDWLFFVCYNWGK